MKKALLLGLALGAMASAAISVGATASASGTEASASGQKTWAKFSGAHVYKPSTLFFGAHEEIDNHALGRRAAPALRGGLRSR